MAVKVRISYEKPQELHTVLKMLNPIVKSYKAEKGGSGRFKKAYLDVEISEGKVRKSADTPLI